DERGDGGAHRLDRLAAGGLYLDIDSRCQVRRHRRPPISCGGSRVLVLGALAAAPLGARGLLGLGRRFRGRGFLLLCLLFLLVLHFLCEHDRRAFREQRPQRGGVYSECRQLDRLERRQPNRAVAWDLEDQRSMGAALYLDVLDRSGTTAVRGARWVSGGAIGHGVLIASCGDQAATRDTT